AKAAAPILFDVFASLGGKNQWFEAPYNEMSLVPLCRHSGHIASSICPDVDSAWVLNKGLRLEACPYHEEIFLDPSQDLQVNSECESPLDMRRQAYLILPPTMETYYRQAHPDFVPLPPFREDCLRSLPPQQQLALIYPRRGTRIYLPRDLDGSLSSVVFEAAHRDPSAWLYWHLDDQYLGKTRELHEMAIQPEAGEHSLSIVDESGAKVNCSFEILEREQ
ncbi:MAG: penicillin-binding protein 1C, partial [Bacteroidota bacterium]